MPAFAACGRFGGAGPFARAAAKAGLNRARAGCGIVAIPGRIGPELATPGSINSALVSRV
jgi:hypothetical protein